MAENQYDFPTEVLDLPSKGLLYPKGNPLSSGQIDIKYMTAKEEDILTSTNLLEKGIAIDKLLESIIANPKIKLDDILLGDKNAIMIGARVLGYGKDYEITITDPDTTLEVKSVVDLTTIKVEMDEEHCIELRKKLFFYIDGGLNSPMFLVNKTFKDQAKKVNINYLVA